MSGARRATARRGSGAVADPVTAFFTALAAKGYEPLLHMARGTLAFALAGGVHVQHWVVTMANGAVVVSRGRRRADCTVGASRDLFARLITGGAQPWTAYLREEFEVSGNIELLVAFQRLLPDRGLAGDDGRPADCGEGVMRT